MKYCSDSAVTATGLKRLHLNVFACWFNISKLYKTVKTGLMSVLLDSPGIFLYLSRIREKPEKVFSSKEQMLQAKVPIAFTDDWRPSLVKNAISEVMSSSSWKSNTLKEKTKTGTTWPPDTVLQILKKWGWGLMGGLMGMLKFYFFKNLQDSPLIEKLIIRVFSRKKK